mgnify:CR=1 FL=1
MIGCTPLVSWVLFGSGILVGVALGTVLAGLLRAAKEADTPWLFWCPNCKAIVRTRYTEEEEA